MFSTSIYVDVVDIGLIWNRVEEEKEEEGFLSNNC